MRHTYTTRAVWIIAAILLLACAWFGFVLR